MSDIEKGRGKEAPKISVYELTGYYCSLKLVSECDEVDTSSSVITVTNKGSDSLTYISVFKNAFKNAPLCPTHGTQMIPQILEMTGADTPED